MSGNKFYSNKKNFIQGIPANEQAEAIVSVPKVDYSLGETIVASVELCTDVVKYKYISAILIRKITYKASTNHSGYIVHKKEKKSLAEKMVGPINMQSSEIYQVNITVPFEIEPYLNNCIIISLGYEDQDEMDGL